MMSLTIEFMHGQAGLTLICAIINISSTSPSTYEILILDLIQQVIWIAATVNMAFYIAGNDAFGSCAKASALLKSSCTVSQLVLWAGVALMYAQSLNKSKDQQLKICTFRNISLAKLAIAFCVRRQTLRKPSQQPDCEKLHIVPLSY
jgi:hypothetical protein